jgi:L-lactate utilization protein LutB
METRNRNRESFDKARSGRDMADRFDGAGASVEELDAEIRAWVQEPRDTGAVFRAAYLARLAELLLDAERNLYAKGGE